jgi:site-specific recombinase XerD
LQAEGKSKATLDVYGSAVKGLTAFTQHLPSTSGPIRAYLAHLLDTRSPATAHNRFRALRTFFNWCVDEGLLDVSPMHVVRAPTVPEKVTSTVGKGTLSALLRACNGTTFEDRRDMAIIRLFADTGCRRQELAALSVGDVDMDTRTLVVIGKGRRIRTVPFGPQAATALRGTSGYGANTVTAALRASGWARTGL